MMRIRITCLIIIYLTFLIQPGRAQRYSGRWSLYFRGGFWHPSKSDGSFQFTNIVGGGEVEGDIKASFSSGFDTFHWMTDNFAIGLSLGMLGRHEDRTKVDGGTVESWSHQVGLVPIHLGARMNLFPYWQSAFRPYVAAGGGIYWGFERFEDKFVGYGTVQNSNNIKSETIPGGYLGGGLDIILFPKGILEFDFFERSFLSQGFLGHIFSTGFGFNIDYRYHFVQSKKELGGQKDWNSSEITFGITFIFGKPKSGVQVKRIELITTNIYPAFYKHYADFPIGWVTLKNTTRKLIEARVALQNDEYMTHATYTDFIEIPSKSEKTISVTAVFNENITKVQTAKPATINFIIETRTIDQFRFTKSTKCVIHSRNGWNGDVSKLPFFVTPDDSKIMNLARSSLRGADENVQQTHLSDVNNLLRARIIFDHLNQMGMSYEHDPNLPYYKNDYVQYPVETLERKTGDCDDLAVLYASMLESVGIRTAFIDVRGRDTNSNAHVYIMFDSGVSPDHGWRISSNEKKYIVRNIDENRKSLWIPIETTLLTASFEKAWEVAALDYLREAVINQGLEDGHVKIVDME